MKRKGFIAALLSMQVIVSAITPAYAKPIVYDTAHEKAHEAVMSYVESQEDDLTVKEICFQAGERYSLNPYLLLAVAERESQFTADAKNGHCLGLMQVDERYHRDRMERLGVTDLTDPYGCVMVASDYLAELREEYFDIRLVLMLYSMRADSAMKIYRQGRYTAYAEGIYRRAEELEDADRWEG